MILAEAQLAIVGGMQVTACMKSVHFSLRQKSGASMKRLRIFAKIDVELRWAGLRTAADDAIG